MCWRASFLIPLFKSLYSLIHLFFYYSILRKSRELSAYFQFTAKVGSCKINEELLLEITEDRMLEDITEPGGVQLYMGMLAYLIDHYEGVVSSELMRSSNVILTTPF